MKRRSGGKSWAVRRLRQQVVLGIALGGLFCISAFGQHSSPPEQTRFGVETEVKRPAPIPAEIVESLREDRRNRTCLEEGQSAARIDASWFVGSIVNLNGRSGNDLIVKPQNPCLLGANLGPFWIYRETANGYRLVLAVDALALELLSRRTNGLRDIVASAATASTVSRRTYSFNGSRYERRARPQRRGK